MALIDTLRQITSTEDDDYFQDATLVFYINESQKAVTSLISQREKTEQKSFRALDALRASDANVLTGFSADGSHFTGTQAVPTSFLEWSYLDYEGTPLLELPISKQYLLKWGNHSPSVDEGYFSISGSNIKCFLHENPDGTTDTLTVQYIKLPTDITSVSTSFTEIPDQLITAVLYQAAVLMSAQENRDGLANFEQQFQKHLEMGIF